MGITVDKSKRSPSNSFTVGREGNKVEAIIIHHWGDFNQQHDAVVNYFQRGPQVSPHFVVSAGRVNEMVSLSDTAWCAGNFATNLRSVNIECRPEMSAGDFDTVAEVCAYVFKQIGRVVPLRGHCDIVATACPGLYYPQLGRLHARAVDIYNASAPVTPVAPVRPSEPAAAGFLVQVATDILNVRQGPSGASRAVGSVRRGEVFTIVEKVAADGYTWGRLKSGRGWVALEFTQVKGSAAPVVPPVFQPYAVRIVEPLNVRALPSTSSKVVTTVKPGQSFTIVGTSNGGEWGRLKSGAGWIALAFTRKI